MRERIMVIEDDAALLRIEAELLEGSGYDVSPFTDPRRALEALAVAAEDVGVLLLDLRMPAMNGCDFLRILQQDPRLRLIPVILTTGAPRSAPLEGVFARITKPFGMETLLVAVEAALNERSRAATRESVRTCAAM